MKFLKNDISSQIENFKMQNPTVSYIECALEVCEQNDIEFESLKKALSKTLKEKIEFEANELNLLKIKRETLYK
ncbi:MAG: late promoter transcription accessory protein [Candidatus Thiodiazotropha taylori]|uniref:Late promoter transcription accessory protein n=1 Tax=Candidatus Thiodiazotropha taylori TaxID=2792791 RepID=A0A9E4N3H7_9GAMM|nr:late promoter transcription accessory protein [Candidatus Thiodiazotropha taylori]MCW4254979.1 late promoter transcription accessory protein [Candidatus Thiodiazotropha taylori]